MPSGGRAPLKGSRLQATETRTDGEIEHAGPSERAGEAADTGGRRALIDATVAAIDEDGLAEVSLRAITRRAAVSHAAPAHHFRDKAGLFTAVALEGFGMLQQALSGALDTAQEQGPVERMQALGVAYVRFAIEHRAHFEVMFRPELLRQDDPELHQAGLTTFGILRDAAQSAQDEGFGGEWDVDDFALASWALVHGIVQLTAQGVLGKLGFPAGAVELTATLTHLVGETITRVSQQ